MTNETQLDNDTRSTLARPRRTPRGLRASIGRAIALVCSLSALACTHAPAPSTGSPESPRRPSIARVEPCLDAPVEEPVCTTSPVK